jgi:flavin reductase (DIM6/NTAB) family NADH-FMN oxidoreductase RutF
VIAQAWKCHTCSHVVVGLFPPESCPKCGAPRSAFETEHSPLFAPDELDGVVRACHKITYGLYVVTSIDGARMNGQICNTLFQVTSDPPRIAIGINHVNLTHEFIERSGVFAASILGRDDQRIVRRFGYRSGRDFDKLKGVPVRIGKTGCPILEESIGYIECRVLPDKTIDAGTHSIFVGEVIGAGFFRDAESLTYEHYRATKGSA